MRKSMIAVAVLLFFAGQQAWGQSCTGYSFGQAGWLPFVPSDVVTQGNPAAILAITANGGIASHHLTATSGIQVTHRWTGLCPAGHNCSATSYFTEDGGSTRYSWDAQNLSGSSTWTFTADQAGHYFVPTYVVTDNTTGIITQDAIKVIVVTGTPVRIVNQDGVPEPVYLRINPNFGGAPMDSTCSLCINNPHACTGARHTPYMSGTVTNHTSGEVQTFQRAQAGNIVNETTPISGSAYWFISTNPTDGADIEVGATGEIFCSVESGDIFEQFISWRIEYGKVVAADLGHPPRAGADGSLIFDVAVLCDNNSDPPDWRPTVVHSFSGRHKYWWGITSLFRAPDIQGTAWVPLGEFLLDWTYEGPLNIAKMVIQGGALPYPGPAPDFPIPGACTQYPKNVILTVGSADLPWWPFNN